MPALSDRAGFEDRKERRALSGPLSDVRVIDLTSVVMGPYATQILGDLGADIIKVESPAGDTTRKLPPMRNPDMGHVFLNLNRNKRSVVLDLKRTEGLAALMKLAEVSDLLIYNIRPKAMARLGITHEKLAAINPRLISVSLVGSSQDGPYAAHPVYEDLIQGLTAVPSILVDAGSGYPHYVPMAFNDRAVGSSAVNAILAALYLRATTNRGQEIEIPMFETMAQAALTEHLGGLTFEPPIGPPGYQRTLTKERRPYSTRDGYVCVIIYTDKHWRSFMTLVGEQSKMTEDPRLRDIGARTTYAHELYAYVAQVMETKTTAEWLRILRTIDIPVAPLHSLASLVEDDHLTATGFIKLADHPSEGRIRHMGIPGRWSESELSIRRFAPRLGEHSVEVLREAGVSPEEIRHLLKTGATVQPPEPEGRNSAEPEG